MIFVPSYFDFVRLRNWLKERDYHFAALSEYSSGSDIARNRTFFMDGRLDILLVTERFYFFRRYKIRGIKHALFYGLPEHAHFYSEIVNRIEASNDETATILYSKYDRLKMERVLGIGRTNKMIEGKKETFMYTA